MSTKTTPIKHRIIKENLRRTRGKKMKKEIYQKHQPLSYQEERKIFPRECYIFQVCNMHSDNSLYLNNSLNHSLTPYYFISCYLRIFYSTSSLILYWKGMLRSLLLLCANFVLLPTLLLRPVQTLQLCT